MSLFPRRQIALIAQWVSTSTFYFMLIGGKKSTSMAQKTKRERERERDSFTWRFLTVSDVCEIKRSACCSINFKEFFCCFNLIRFYRLSAIFFAFLDYFMRQWKRQCRGRQKEDWEVVFMRFFDVCWGEEWDEIEDFWRFWSGTERTCLRASSTKKTLSILIPPSHHPNKPSIQI